MHHYGEDAVKAVVFDASFAIELRNHETGAAILIVGPRQGIFQHSDAVLDQGDALRLGHEIAHLLRQVTGANQ
jgi:hypothetical protein